MTDMSGGVCAWPGCTCSALMRCISAPRFEALNSTRGKHMTTTDLVGRLIAFAGITPDHPSGGSFLNPKAVELVEQAVARITELEAALRPFSDVATYTASEHPGWDHDEYQISIGMGFKHFRRARAALAEKP